MVQQRVDERPVEIARRGMDDEPGGLVDDEEMLVLEHDRERNVLRLVVRGRWLRNDEAKASPPLTLSAGSRTAEPWDSTAPLRINA